MKKEKQFLMDRLSCKISCIKSNDTIVLVRDEVADEHGEDDEEDHFTYNEMIPSYSWEQLSPSTSLHC